MVSVKKVVVVGGGTGTYTALLGLKKYPIDLSVVVSMMDDGGSNKIIRDEFGLLPTSDIRQCIVALSSNEVDSTIRKLFSYRYNAGIGISGMTFGNLFMAALTDIYEGNQEKAIDETCKMLRVQGNIAPVTYEKTHLVARYSNGKQILGEHNIDEPCDEVAGHKIVEIEVFPPVKANFKALKIIKEADLIVFGPGDLYTSILPNIVIDEVSQTIRKSKAKKAFVVNLMTRHGQTDGFSAKDHLKEFEKYLGEGIIDYCLVNKSKEIPKNILKRYEQENAYPVKDDFTEESKLRVIRADFISNVIYEKPKSDKMIRSLIRHDSAKLAKTIISLL